jgi:hypothetical protein
MRAGTLESVTQVRLADSHEQQQKWMPVKSFLRRGMYREYR